MSGLMPRRRVEPDVAEDHRRQVQRDRVRDALRSAREHAAALAAQGRQQRARDAAHREQADQQRRARARPDHRAAS